MNISFASTQNVDDHSEIEIYQRKLELGKSISMGMLCVCIESQEERNVLLLFASSQST